MLQCECSVSAMIAVIKGDLALGNSSKFIGRGFLRFRESVPKKNKI